MMLNKKLIILSIFIVSLLTISVVSAAENVTSDVGAVEEATADAISVDEVKEVVSVENNQVILENVSDDVAENLSTVTVYNEKHERAAGDPQEELKELTVKDRTFYIGKYKAVLSYAQWYDLRVGPIATEYYLDYGVIPNGYAGNYYDASTALFYNVAVKTDKFITIKYGKGKYHEVVKKVKIFKTKKQAKNFVSKYNKKFFKYYRYYDYIKKNGKYIVKKHFMKYSKVITKKARVFMHFNYGGGQYGSQNHNYRICLYTNYDNPGYEIFYHSKNLRFYKVGNNLRTLTKTKLRTF